MIAQLIKVDGTTEDIMPKNGKTFTLEECYRLIGTDMVEIVHTNNKNIMIVDEEGKLKGKSINGHATQLYENGGKHYIVGDVIFCNKKMFK